MPNKRVLLGMSGGVDSTVAAILLKKQGYEVIGANMLLCQDKENESFIEICEKLDIEHYTFDLRKEFKDKVISNFIDEYKNGRTPNPCVVCNKFMKFGIFFEKAKELNCEYIATGHYAKTRYSEKYNCYTLQKAENLKKDQTYFLYNIKPEELEKIIFPLGEFEEKEEIRQIAKEYGLEVHNKKDSQEICFIPDNDYVRFLKENSKIDLKKGKIKNIKGEILGEHEGLINYTIGQRKGLGVTYKEPLYVIKIDIQKNELIVGTEEELYSNYLEIENVNIVLPIDITKENIKAKIRYAAKEAECEIEKIENDKIKLKFKEPQRAITKGQSVVIYVDNIVLGGGVIV